MSPSYYLPFLRFLAIHPLESCIARDISLGLSAALLESHRIVDVVEGHFLHSYVECRLQQAEGFERGVRNLFTRTDVCWGANVFHLLDSRYCAIGIISSATSWLKSHQCY